MTIRARLISALKKLTPLVVILGKGVAIVAAKVKFKLKENIKKIPAIIGTIGVIIIIITSMSYLVTPPYLITTRSKRIHLAILSLGLALFLYYIIWEWERVVKIITARAAKYGINVLVMAVALIGILGLLNFVSARHQARFDLTATKRFTLSDQTKKILANLKKNVQITAFFSEADPRLREVKDLLKEYTIRTDKINARYIDPDLNPALTQQYKVKYYGTTVLESGTKRQDISGTEEQDFTSALLKVSEDKERKIYFLVGHGERDPEERGKDGYQTASEALKRENYLWEKISLATNPDLPKDCATLIIAGPKKPLVEKEIEVLDNYLKQGGKVLIMLDPWVASNLNKVVERWGVSFEDNFIIDLGSHFWTDVLSPAVLKYGYHEITRNLPTTFFPEARAITVKKELSEGIQVTKIVETSQNSWAETDKKVAKYDEGKDLKGPVPIAVAVRGEIKPEKIKEGKEIKEKKEGEEKKIKTRLVVIGDSDFASNSFFGMLGNGDLFVNAINWLAGEEELITIRPKTAYASSVQLTGKQMNLVFYSTVFWAPLLVLILGGLIWWRRR